jgi:hypothetical protein
VWVSPEADGGKGYGTAAKIGAMAVGYEAGIQMFGTHIAQDNSASRRSAAKVGYVQLPESIVPTTSMLTGPNGEPAVWGNWLAFSPNADHQAPPAMVDMSQQAFRDTSARYRVEPKGGATGQETNPGND